jgi:F-type H+-transporting ATPase subunit b
VSSLTVQFAAAEPANSGIGAFNINLKSFVFQLVTFLIVLYIFRRWILPPILKTLEERRRTVEESLEHAKQTEAKLAEAESRTQALLLKAREQADKALAEARVQAKELIAKAEDGAEIQAQRIVKETEERLGQERQKLHDQLKAELGDLVVLTTEKVLRRKIDEQEDRRLIEDSLKELASD